MLNVSSWIVDLTLSSPCSLSFHYKNLRADFRWRPSCTVRNFYVLISVGSICSFSPIFNSWITSEGMWLWLTFVHLYVSSWPVGYRYFFYLMKLMRNFSKEDLWSHISLRFITPTFPCCQAFCVITSLVQSPLPGQSTQPQHTFI